MADDSKETIADTIRQFPSQLQAPDIEDFCQLALYYSSRTPQSFRRDYHGPLYGSHFMADGFENVTVHTLLCLPVSIQELLKSSSTSSPSKRKRESLDGEEEDDVLRYFVVDGRPPKQYNNGHLPGAFSIDASLVSTCFLFIFFLDNNYSLFRLSTIRLNFTLSPERWTKSKRGRNFKVIGVLWAADATKRTSTFTWWLRIYCNGIRPTSVSRGVVIKV